MSAPLLDLSQDWQRQRAQLRAAQRRPPPLVTAGLDIQSDAQAAHGRTVQIHGLALVFGLFPASFADFVELARTRLRMGGDQVRQELQGLLHARIQALWAWLPGLSSDMYAEVDHATGEVRVWQIGPGDGQLREIDVDHPGEHIDDAFLEGLVLNGTRHWGGAAGLARLVRRFGPRPLLVAAQVAELLERGDVPPDIMLQVARTRWDDLDAGDEDTWEVLVDLEHPWVCAQLGRLALRLGLSRPARHLLDRVHAAQAGPSVWIDLTEACESVDDLAGAELAAAQAANLGADARTLRRLVSVRVRLGRLREASEGLARLRAVGGTDSEIVEDLLAQLLRPALPLLQRAHIAGWLGAHTVQALEHHLSLDELLERIAQAHPIISMQVGRYLEQTRVALAADLGKGTGEAVVAALRIVLLAMPFRARSATTVASDCAAHALLALRIWAEASFGVGRVPESIAVRQALLGLARVAVAPNEYRSEVDE